MAVTDLLDALRQRLHTCGQQVSEHALIGELAEAGLLPRSFNSDKLTLFQTHFMLFNALYRLSDELASRQLALEIGLVNIRVRALELHEGRAALDSGDRASLRAYYLDWSNFTGATEEGVVELLENFWQHFGRAPVAAPEKQAALALLELREPVTWREIKQRYRRLAMREHPDRGGSNASLQALNEAMAVLARAYKPC